MDILFSILLILVATTIATYAIVYFLKKIVDIVIQIKFAVKAFKNTINKK